MKRKKRYATQYHVVNRKLHKAVERRKRKKKWLRATSHTYRGWNNVSTAPAKVFDDKAPEDFRLLENTQECSEFFQRMRDAANNGKKRYGIDLKKVSHIDFASTMMLTAIGEELQNKGCRLGGNSPQRPTCERYLIDSGFFNGKFDQNGLLFPSVKGSEFIKVERGQYKLTKDHYAAFRTLIKHINMHLIGSVTKKRIHNTIIKEICANSVEWSEAEKSQWTLGAKFETDKVIIVALDLGKGILEKLYLDYWAHIKNLVSFKTGADILYGAFEQKYGSTAMETNRKRGLPCVKAAFDDGHIKDLKVVTNNSRIDFSTSDKKIFAGKQTAFMGTLYSWIIDADCLQ